MPLELFLKITQEATALSSCGPFTKHHERIKEIKGTSKLKYIYFNEWDEACFANNVAYSNGKDLAKRTLSGKILKYRTYVRFKGNIMAVDLIEMGPLSSKNQGIKYLLCVIYFFFQICMGSNLWKVEKVVKQFFGVILK